MNNEIISMILACLGSGKPNTHFYPNVFGKYPCTNVISAIDYICQELCNNGIDGKLGYGCMSKYIYAITVGYVNSGTKEIPYSLLVTLIKIQKRFNKELNDANYSISHVQPDDNTTGSLCNYFDDMIIMINSIYFDDKIEDDDPTINYELYSPVHYTDDPSFYTKVVEYKKGGNLSPNYEDVILHEVSLVEENTGNEVYINEAAIKNVEIRYV